MRNDRYKRWPEDISKKFSDTVSENAQTFVKYYSTPFRTISLLKLSDEIQMAICNSSVLVIFVKEVYPWNEYRNILGATRLGENERPRKG